MRAFGRLLACVSVVSLFFSVQEVQSQVAPGTYADANHPAGAPDPEKLSQIWQVDPIGGQVSIKIPFLTTPQGGRGPKIPFALLYNSGSTLTLQASGTYYVGNDTVSTFQWSPTPLSSYLVAPSGPWVTTGPYFSSSSISVPDSGYYDFNNVYIYNTTGCSIGGPYSYTDESGGSHDAGLEFYVQNTPPATGASLANACGYASASVIWSTSSTADGSAMATADGTVTGPDGTTFTGGPSYQGYPNHILTDTNGNQASISISSGIATAKDALSRTVYVTNIPIGKPGQIPAGSYYVKTYDTSGGAETYTVTFSTKYINPTGSLSMPHPANYTEACYNGCNGNLGILQAAKNAPFSTITQIGLPDGTSYGFQYDATYGTISKITFPTGGYVRFDWAIRPYSWTPYGAFTAISDLVVRQVYASAGDGVENVWTYDLLSQDPATTGSVPSGTYSTVYAPDNSYSTYSYTSRIDNSKACFDYTKVPETSLIAKLSCKPASTYTYDANGRLIKTVDENFNGHGLSTRAVAALYDGQTPVQQQVLDVYDQWDNVVEKDESDFYNCSGSPCPIPSSLPVWKRSTFTSYAYAADTTLANAHIVNKPSQVLVTNGVGSNGSGTSSSGTPYQLINYSYDSKGNVLNENKCLQISGSGTSATCSSAWQTNYDYDATGQVLHKIEAYGTSKAATTSYTWGGQANGFLLNIQHPNGASDSYTYYTQTGQVKTHTGWNTGQTTNYDYTDPLHLHRIKTITAPQTIDGTTGSNGNGTTTFNYTDVAGGFSVEERHSVDTSGTTSSTTKSYDGLGRERGTLTASPQCASGIKIDTIYNSMGLVDHVTNPYCGTTNGATYYQYDALGRRIQTTLPDGAISTTSYAGNATQVTDPSNGTTSVQHIQQVDGLGHLTNVCEVSSSALGSDASPSSCGLNKSGSGYLTTYTYDPPGNMVNVSQHGLTRWFVYDAMSRLKQAMNPEAGSSPDIYTYSTPTSACAADPGVPCTRTDARGVLTTYAYDNMSRLRGKSYSAASGNTTGAISDLSSCYQYDTQLSGVTDSNPSGQLVAEWQQAGACPTSGVTTVPAGSVAVRIFSDHDSMGRVRRDQQCLTSSTCSSTTGNFVYSYNLLGSPVQANNGIVAGTVSASQAATTNTTPMTAPSATWKTTYDSMGHLSTAIVQDQPNTSVWPVSSVGAAFSFAPTLLQPTNYDTFGHMTAAQLGTPNGSSTAPLNISRQYDVRGRIQLEQDQGTVVTGVASGSVGNITISGSEKSTAQNGAAASANIGISGNEQSTTIYTCPMQYGGCPTTIYDGGGYSIYVNGVSAGGFGWSQGATGTTLAASLASSINGNSNSPVTASASGSTVTITSKITGPAGNYSISVTRSWSSSYFSSPSFSVSAPSSMSGGVSGGTTYDSGTVSATINSKTATVSWGNGSTSSSVASALASAITTTDGSFLTASASGSVVSLASIGTGSAKNWPIQVSVTYDTAHFSSSSFTPTSSGMSGGSDGGSSYGTIYSYQVPSGGYAPNGNILQHVDSVMGTWNFGYDAVDRLITANQSASTSLSTQYAGKYGCWSYDSRGNRTMEAFSSANCSSNPTPQVLNTYSANNQISSSTLSSSTLAAGSFIYDASGHTLYDGLNEYWYDAEGQLCAVQSLRYGRGPVIQYAYDGSGARIGKGTMASPPAAYTVIASGLASSPTCAPPLGSNFSTTARYLVDTGGQQLTELDGAGSWRHSNVWAGGKLVATYDTKGIHFELSDPLGTKRVQANAQGQVDEWCTGLPFGNDLNNPVAANCTFANAQTNPLQTYDDATEHHFTQKERDTDTGNDYFFARYYTSALGRFISPDWSAKAEPVPYAKLDNPQSLNLYSYVINNPLIQMDSDGHEIIYAPGLKNEQKVRDTVQAILADPHTSGNLSGYVGPNSPNLTIKSGDLSGGDTRTVSPDGKTVTTTTVQGNTAPDIQTTTFTDNNGVTTSETTLTGAAVTIDNRTSTGDLPGVMVHESVHAGEAKANPAQFNKDATAEKKANPNCHDCRPQEQRANAAQKAYGAEIKKAVKQIEKDRKEENK